MGPHLQAIESLNSLVQLDTGMMKALPLAVRRPCANRSDFDKVVLQESKLELETCIAARERELGHEGDASSSAIADKEAAVAATSVAEVAFAAARQRQRESAAVLRSADISHRESVAAMGEAEFTITQAENTRCLAEQKLFRAQCNLAEFRNEPLMAFKILEGPPAVLSVDVPPEEVLLGELGPDQLEEHQITAEFEDTPIVLPIATCGRSAFECGTDQETVDAPNHDVSAIPT